MAGNPNIPQGVLNKVLGAVSVIDDPALNVSAGYLGDDGISLAFEGDASAYPGTMTGAVPSPNPYQMAVLTIALLKTQPLSDVYKSQIETETAIGDVVVTPDAVTLSSYYLSNCVIMGARDLNFAGKAVEYMITIRGTYQVNADMFA